MNAIQALNLRKPDKGGLNDRSPMSQYQMSEVSSSRAPKKSNIKEMLIRNFFRQYPITLVTPDADQLEIERNVARQMEDFVSGHQGSINSKELHEFETRLAKDMGLTKRAPEDHLRSPLGAPAPKRGLIISQGQQNHPQVVRDSSGTVIGAQAAVAPTSLLGARQASQHASLHKLNVKSSRSRLERVRTEKNLLSVPAHGEKSRSPNN